MPPTAPVITADRVAELLSTVAAANSRIAAEIDRIAGSRSPVGLATVDRLARLAADLRPGAEARAVLARIDPDLLLAGTALWLSRRRQRSLCHPAEGSSATGRAAARWGRAQA
jgi:hypothetical protein